MKKLLLSLLILTSTTISFAQHDYDNQSTIFSLGGNVGIGAPSSGFKLDVNGTINATNILINGQALPSGSSPWATSGSNINYTTGNVGIGTTSTSAYKLNVNGPINATGLMINGQAITQTNYQDWPANPSTFAYFGTNTLDQSQVGNYALLQQKIHGATLINSPNYVDLRINNSPKMRLLSNGNIGIGTTSPSSILTLNHGSSPMISFETSGVGHASLGTGTNGNLVFYTGGIFGGSGIERLRISSTGNVGIGTNNPVHALDVDGTINATDILINGQALPSGSSPWITNGNDINYTTGSVGIGTTNPDETLHIDGTVGIGEISGSNSEGLRLEYVDGGSGNTTFKHNRWGGYFKFKRDGSTGERTQLRFGGSGHHFLEVYNDNNEVKVKLNSGGDTYFNGGNVGIGTTTPSSKLDISNQGDGAELLKFSTDRPWVFRQKATGASAKLDLHSTIDNKSFIITSVANNRVVEFFAGNSSTTDKVYLVPDGGNVGIGTTSPAVELDIKGSVNLNNQFSTTAGELNPAYYVHKHNLISYGMKLQYTGSEFGTMIFGPNQANRFISFGKVGGQLNDASMVEYMRVDLDNGNVGIGTTTPQSKLQILGGSGEQTQGQIHVVGNGGTGDGDAYISFDEGSEQNSKWSVGARDNDNGFAISNSLTMDANTKFIIKQGSGNVGIGTTTPQSKLAVNGKIRATEVKVTADVNVPDYVFAANYELRTLKETQQFIAKNQHLPEIPSASEIGKNGFDLGEMDMRLLKKIEELTLYQIDLMEKLEKQSAELESLRLEVQELEK